MPELPVGGVVVDLAGELIALFGGFSAAVAALARSSVLARTRGMRGSMREELRGHIVEDATLIGAGVGSGAALIALVADLLVR